MAVQKKTQIIALLVTLSLIGAAPAYAQSQEMQQTIATNPVDSTRFLTRGEAVHQAVQTFDLRSKNADFIVKCLAHLDECFFTFTASTRFYQVTLDPLKLYPDLSDAYPYAGDINLATMLGLVHGNIDETNSPFYPRAYMTRVQALKVVLGAADMMSWKERFELITELGSENALKQQPTAFRDVNAFTYDSWWYPRYVNFSLENKVIDAGEYFRPDEPITAAEYQDLLQRALKASATSHATDSKTQPSGNSSQQAVY